MTQDSVPNSEQEILDTQNTYKRILETLVNKRLTLEKTQKAQKEIEESIKQLKTEIELSLYGKQRATLKAQLSYAVHTKAVLLNLENRLLTSINSLETTKEKLEKRKISDSK